MVLSGHPKTGQRWSGQNRPTEEAGDSVVLPRGFLRRQVYFRAPTSRTAFENMTVMEEAIEHGGQRCAFTPKVAPVLHWALLAGRKTVSLIASPLNIPPFPARPPACLAQHP